MKSLLSVLISSVFVSGISLASPHSATFVTCKSLDANDDFTINFLGHPTEEKTIQVNFISSTGKTLLSWPAPINGIATKGFIKIAEEEMVGPYSRLITTILSDYDPSIPVNTPFEAKYRQWVYTGGKTADVVKYELTCSSPY